MSAKPKARKPANLPTLEKHRFKPGQSGNPGGRPKKLPITELYTKILSNPSYIAKLKKSIEKMTLSGRMAAQLQLKEMAERVEGRVTQPVQVDGEIKVSLAEAIQKARQRAGTK